MSESSFGIQPLENVMADLGLSNANLVEASTEQLTFRMAHKARKGRKISLKLQQKILRALRNQVPDQHFELKQIFNY